MHGAAEGAVAGEPEGPAGEGGQTFRHWMVAVTQEKLYCVVTRTGAGPVVSPKPVLTPVPLSMPIVLPEGSACELEDAAMRANLMLGLAQEAAAGDFDASGDRSVAGEAMRLAHTATDKSVLRLFHAACRVDRPARAADLAAQLQLPASLNGALKLANALHQVVLAERVTLLIQGAMEAEELAQAAQWAAANAGHASLAYNTPTFEGAPQTILKASSATAAVDANPLARRPAPAPHTPAAAVVEEDASGSENQPPSQQRAVAPASKAAARAADTAGATAPAAKKSRVTAGGGGAANPFARR